MKNNCRIIKLGLILFIILTATQSFAQIIEAESCSQEDVQMAINTADYGDTVIIPASGATSYNWTSGIDITKNIKIVGAGVDLTILTLDFTDNITEEALFKFIPDATSRNNLDSLSDTHTFEVKGITFAGNNRMRNKFGIWISNYNTPAIRRVNIHHCKFTSVHRAVQVMGYSHGVFHNNTLINSNGSYPQGAGPASFTNDRMMLGSGKGWYIEDNIFSYTSYCDAGLSGAANSGGGYVVRYNTVTGEMSNRASYVETHGNQLSGIYGPQITEVYGNLMTAEVGRVTNARGGKNIYLNNVFADPDIQIWEEYSDDATSGIYPVGRCDEPGQGVGRQNCTDDCICQKVHDSYFLNNRLFTATGTVISAEVAMDYENRSNGIDNDPPEIIENIEFFNHHASFDGTSGVGCGTLANRPTTCTVGVGYWATDQSCSDLTDMIGVNPATPISGILYKCTETNVWTEWYSPYIYPHPLRNSDFDNIPVGTSNTFQIQNIYPNPLKTLSTISFNIKEAGEYQINIINTLGQKVKHLFKREYTEGQHEITWDGTNNYGKKVQKGVYFVKINSSKQFAVGRIVVLKQ